MFVLRSKVVLEDRSDAVARFGLAGQNAEAQLTAALGRAPAAVNEVAAVDGVVALRCAGPTPRFELIGPPEALQSLWTTLAAHAKPVGTDAWWLFEILSGVPQVFKASLEEFVPQMVNLPAVGGVSFQKGCYPGQEIVARMHYLGTLKRRMYLARIATDEPPAPATPLYEGGADATQSVGNVVYAQRAPEGGCAALAVLVIAAAERGTIHVSSNTGPALTLGELPYALQ
jgi:folate-binding protein YgfZ